MRKLQIAPQTQSMPEVYGGSVGCLMAFFTSSKAWSETVGFAGAANSIPSQVRQITTETTATEQHPR
jgi:hypothetical protein